MVKYAQDCSKRPKCSFRRTVYRKQLAKVYLYTDVTLRRSASWLTKRRKVWAGFCPARGSRFLAWRPALRSRCWRHCWKPSLFLRCSSRSRRSRACRCRHGSRHLHRRLPSARPPPQSAWWEASFCPSPRRCCATNSRSTQSAPFASASSSISSACRFRTSRRTRRASSCRSFRPTWTSWRASSPTSSLISRAPSRCSPFSSPAWCPSTPCSLSPPWQCWQWGSWGSLCLWSNY